MKYSALLMSIFLVLAILKTGYTQPIIEDEPLAQYEETPELEEKEIEIVDEQRGSFNSKEAERYLTRVNPGFVGISLESNQQLSANTQNLKLSPGAESLPYSVLSVGDYNSSGNGGKAFLKVAGFVGAVALEYADDRHCTVD